MMADGSGSSDRAEGGAVLPLTALRAMLDDDAAVREVLVLFRTSLEETREGVCAAIASHDMAGLVFHAHRFKSAAGQMEAESCFALCAQVQDVARGEGAAVRGEVEGLAGQLVVALERLARDIERTMAVMTE